MICKIYWRGAVEEGSREVLPYTGDSRVLLEKVRRLNQGVESLLEKQVKLTRVLSREVTKAQF